jgi:uncharacterized hydrophobic protein (TIGR00271 family)
MSVVVIQKESLIGPDLRWPLRIAKLSGAEITLLVCVPKNIGEHARDVDLSASAEQPAYDNRIAERVRSALDDYLGPEQWTSTRSGPLEEDEKATSDSPVNRPLVNVRLLALSLLVEEVVQCTPHPRLDQVLFVGSGDPAGREEWTSVIRNALRSTACSVVEIVPGAQQNDGHLMVAAGRGLHGQAAIDLAARLASQTERSLTSLFVEPNIGPDAVEVGHRILDRRLKSARHEMLPAQLTKRVVIHNDPAKGILEACREESPDLLILGADRPEALGAVQLDSVPNRVLRSKPTATLMAVRAAVPFGSQLKRWLVSQVRRRVPQLTRDGRIALVERIQTNSYWNFDFILLIALSALIAALGLLDNSAAVIIGAMLVAPLMTPLLGLGLAIAQENQRLARITLKTAFLGFMTVFCIAFMVGVLSGGFYEATEEMDSRNWPQVLDLIVAFVSGLAAAYASGRPGLLSALPGVAIAAALVPPVTTSGLALSIGDTDVAFGALLLFAVNVVAIVIAAALTLLAMGIRRAEKGTNLTHVLGRSLLALTIAITLVLVYVPPTLAPERELVEDIENLIADQYRLRDIRIRREPEGLKVQVDVGGSQFPDSVLQQRLGEISRTHLGKATGVRLTFRYEAVVR